MHLLYQKQRCPCRCHQHTKRSSSNRILLRRYGIPIVKEIKDKEAEEKMGDGEGEI